MQENALTRGEAYAPRTRISFRVLLSTPPNGELARGLSLRLGQCHVELHYGTVLGTLSQLLLVTTRLRRRLGQEFLSPKTAPWCNSTQHRPSPTRSLTCPPARARIIWCEGDVTRDYSQRRFLAQHSVATLFRMVTTLFQHCNVVLG